MKNIASVVITLFVAFMFLFFIGCGKTQDETAPDVTEKAVAPVEEITEEVYIEYKAHQIYILEKYGADYDKYAAELGRLPDKIGVTEEAINAFSETASEDLVTYSETLDRIGKRVQELLDKDK